jgi:hypothetical protein
MAAGVIGFVWLLTHAGVERLWEQARVLGLGVFLIVALAGLEHLLHAWGWQRCFAPLHEPGLRRLFEAYLAGYAFSLLTPTASLGGDVLRASLLPGFVPATEAAASVTADRLACSVSDACLGLAGVAILLVLGPLEPWQSVALVAATALFGIGIAGFFLVQRSGRLATRIPLHPLVARLGGARLGERLARASTDLDFRLRSLHLERPEAFRGSLLRNLAGSCVGGLQVGVFLALLGTPEIARAAAEIFLVGVALDMFSFFIPARLGVQEGARMLGASVAGLDPSVGLLLSLVLRLEQVVWAGIGLGLHSRLARGQGPSDERGASRYS